MTWRRSFLPSLAATGLALSVGAVPALPNAVSYQRAAGGIEFRSSTTIAIASEDLYLSPAEVRVAYVYDSSATRAQDVDIAFPMPAVEIGDSPEGTYLFDPEKAGDLRNYMRFAVTVDGAPVETVLEERAFRYREGTAGAHQPGAEITERLKQAGVPLLFAKGGQEAVAGLPEALREGLIREQLINADQDGGILRYSPNWLYQVVYTWRQVFKPGRTAVAIRYRPITGSPGDLNYWLGTHDKPGRDKAYCIDAGFDRALTRARANGGISGVETVGYVLKTGNNWNGPIRDFRLVVDKMKAESLVAFCPKEAKRISPTQFEWRAKNFRAERDLDVVFYDRPGKAAP